MRTRTLTEVGIALLGVYAMVRLVEMISGGFIVSVLWHENGTAESITLIAISLIPSACMAILAWVLIRYRKPFAERLARGSENEPAPDDPGPSDDERGYRIASVFAGFIILAWALPTVAMVLYNFAVAVHAYGLTDAPDHFAKFFSSREWSMAAAFALQFGMGLVLIFRAPRIARRLAARATKAEASPPEKA